MHVMEEFMACVAAESAEQQGVAKKASPKGTAKIAAEPTSKTTATAAADRDQLDEAKATSGPSPVLKVSPKVPKKLKPQEVEAVLDKQRSDDLAMIRAKFGGEGKQW